jgi:hypothetical protein
MEDYLSRFVEEKVNEKRRDSPRILSWEAGRTGRERRTIGRAALLNMLFRYRGPRIRLKPQEGRAVEDVAGRPRHRPGEEPSEEDLTVHSMIWRSRCHGIFTTNYDMLLEHAFSLYRHGAALRTYRYTADFLRFILSNPRFVLKLHGDINDIRSMELCPITAWRKGGTPNQRRADLINVYEAALDRGHMVYLGCGFRDEAIHRLHESWKPTDASRRFCRVAVLPEDRAAELRQASAGPWRGIEFLGYPSDRFSEVERFMQEVVSARSGARERWSASPEATDLHRQLFRGSDPLGARRNFSTEPWSCKGVVLPG